MRRNLFFCLVVVSLLGCDLLLASGALAQVVLSRTRLGNNTEDITFVTSGPFMNDIAVLDGYNVLGIPLPGCTRCVRGKLFDVRGLAIQLAPRGITFIQSEHLFAMMDPSQTDKLFLTDDAGQPIAPRSVQYLSGFIPAQNEGLAYIPASSGMYPNRIIEVAIDDVGSRLEVMLTTGQVEAEIFPALSLRSAYITGVAYLASPDRIMVSDDRGIWTLSFNGDILSGPVGVPGVEDIEGIVQVSPTRVAAAGYSAGTVFSFDQNLVRMPNEDRVYLAGVGASQPIGVAWNSDTNQLLVAHLGLLPQTSEAVSVPITLDSAVQVVNLTGLSPRGVAYLPDGQLIAIANPPREIRLFNADGTLSQLIDVSVLGRPTSLTYIPTTMQFAVVFAQQPNIVKILNRDGSLANTLDLSAIGIGQVVGLTFFSDPSGGQFLLIGPLASHQAFITDLSGNLISQFDYRQMLGTLTPRQVAAITTGPQMGNFSVIDADNSEVVVFSLP